MKSEKPKDKKVQEQIQNLEEKNKEVVLDDIKNYQPEIYKQIEKSKETMNADEVASKVISKLYKKAPSETPKYKPSQEELKNMGSDVYDKYFKE